MPWFCIDDGFAFHAKAIAAGNEAIGAWTRAGAWSGAPSNLTDGFIPRDVAHQIAPPRIWQKLIDAKAGKEHGLIEPRPDGYQIHDYLEYNPSAEKVRAKRAAWAERQKKARAPKVTVEDRQPPMSRRDSPVTHPSVTGEYDDSHGAPHSPFPIPHSPEIPPGPPAAALAVDPGPDPEPVEPTATRQTLAGIWPKDPEPGGGDGGSKLTIAELEAMARYAMARPAELTPYERSRVAKVHGRLVSTLPLSPEDIALIVEVDTKLTLRDDAMSGPAPSSLPPLVLSPVKHQRWDLSANAGPKRDFSKRPTLPMPTEEES